MKSALKVKVGNIPVICSRWTYLSHEGYSPFSQIDQSKHCKRSIGVLSQTAITRLGETPEMLERPKRCSTLDRTLDFLRLVSLSKSVNGRFLYARLLVKSLALGAMVLRSFR
jgi:hypothetical protein